MKKFTTLSIGEQEKQKFTALLNRDSEKNSSKYFSNMIEYFERTGINPKSFISNPIIDNQNEFHKKVEKRNTQLANWMGKIDTKYLSVMLKKMFTIEEYLITMNQPKEEIETEQTFTVRQENNKLKVRLNESVELLRNIKSKTYTLVNGIAKELSEDNKGVYVDHKIVVSMENINKFKNAIRDIFEKTK